MATETKGHTPGPWPIEYDNDGNGHYSEWLSVGPARIDVTRYDGSHRARADADARLIAAAPEMLAFIENLCASVEHMIDKQVMSMDENPLATGVMKRHVLNARALLVKIEGQP